MRRDTIEIPQFQSSFLSCEKDVETILQKIFVKSYPNGEMLKRLLVINTKDCLSDMDSKVYQNKINEMSLSKLMKEGYVKLSPKIRLAEHEEVKSYIVITLNNFTPNMTNPDFRDCTITFDIICNKDEWDLDNYQVRPLKIAGYIDAVMNKARLSGIGILNFLGCTTLNLNEDLAGYTLGYRAIHMVDGDDIIPPEEE